VPLENLEMSEPARSLGLSEMAACAPSRMISLWDHDLDQEKSVGASGPDIRCPFALVVPNEDLWPCSCGHPWNTFGTERVTGVVRPSRLSIQCLSCTHWSPHSHWYSN
jgi:hypothetical protein